MSDEFTTEQIEQIEAAYSRACNAEKEDNPDWDKFIAELTNPGWKPAVGQVYKTPNCDIYKHDTDAYGGAAQMPLTTKEAGPEPVQHLVDCIERLASDADFNEADIFHGSRNMGWYHTQLAIRNRFAQECITKHKELMK